MNTAIMPQQRPKLCSLRKWPCAATIATAFVVGWSANAAHATILNCHSSDYGDVVVNTGINTWKQSDGAVITMMPRQVPRIYDLHIEKQHMVFLLRGPSSVLIRKNDGTSELIVDEFSCVSHAN